MNMTEKFGMNLMTERFWFHNKDETTGFEVAAPEIKNRACALLIWIKNMGYIKETGFLPNSIL